MGELHNFDPFHFSPPVSLQNLAPSKKSTSAAPLRCQLHLVFLVADIQSKQSGALPERSVSDSWLCGKHAQFAQFMTN
jgi:hypothetical protein